MASFRSRLIGGEAFRCSAVALVEMVLVPVRLSRSCYYGMGRDEGATVTELRGDELLEEVRRALKAEGCCAEVEIVRLLGARPGRRNWEIVTVGPNTAPPDVRRCIVEIQTRLGVKFQLRSRRRA